MPRRNAGKSLLSSNDARRKAARDELERYERLRTARERVAISRSQDAEERRYFRLRDDASRHAAQRLMRKDIILSEMPKALIGDLSVCKLMRYDILFKELRKAHIEFPFVARAIAKKSHDCTWIWVMIAQ